MADLLDKIRSAWNETLHPRDQGGRFINKGENVKLPDGSVGKVVGARAGADGPTVLVHRGDGSLVSVDSNKTSITATAPSPPSPPATLADDPLPELPHITASHDLVQDSAATNRGYTTGDGYTINCGNAVTAYELRRRGYDVEADPLPEHSDGRTLDAIAANWSLPNGRTPTWTKANTATVANVVNNWPPGARGIISNNFKTGTGHVFNVEKLPNGQVVYMEAQQGGVLDDPNRYFKISFPVVSVLRTDNLSPRPSVDDWVRPTGAVAA